VCEYEYQKSRLNRENVLSSFTPIPQRRNEGEKLMGGIRVANTDNIHILYLKGFTSVCNWQFSIRCVFVTLYFYFLEGLKASN